MIDLLSLAVAPAAASEPAPRLVLMAQPIDYPAAAIAAGQNGDVPVVLHIGADGRLGCRVTGAPGLTLLRRPSCMLVANRWTFALARDAEGKPVPSDLALVVHWKLPSAERDAGEDFGGAIPISPHRWILPDDYPLQALRAEQSGKVLVAFDVGIDGKASNCVVEEAADAKDLGQTACAAVKLRALLLPALGLNGAPRPTRARLRVRFILPPY